MWLLLSSAFAATLCVPMTYDPPGGDCDAPGERVATLGAAVLALRFQAGSHTIRVEQGHVVSETLLLDGAVEGWDDLRIQGDGAGATWTIPGFSDGNSISVTNGAVVEIASMNVQVPSGAASILANADLTLEGVTVERSDVTDTTSPAVLQTSGVLRLIDTEFGPWSTSSDVGHLDIGAGAVLTTIDGGAFEGGDAVVAGAIRALSTVSIDGTTFEGNLSSGNNGGGAVVVSGDGDVTIEGALFFQNEAQAATGNSGGGALRVSAGGTVGVQNTTFDGNTTLGNKGGGAIFVDDPTTVVQLGLGTEFLSNASSGRGGGAIYVEEGDLTVTNAYFFDNFADDERGGGAIYSERGDLSISGTTFEANRSETAADGGGAIHIRKPTNAGNSVFTFSNNAFIDNTSDFRGGAIYVHSDAGQLELVVNNSLFDGNISAEAGGALYLRDQTLTSTNNVFVANQTSGNGDADGGAIAMFANSFPSTSTVHPRPGQVA